MTIARKQKVSFISFNLLYINKCIHKIIKSHITIQNIEISITGQEEKTSALMF